MPIDPRIALGVQPVQTPDFLGYANQAANIRQSRAAEQNALALMAQRQRQEQEAMNVTNALRNLDTTDPAAVSRMYRMPGGGAAAKDIFEAQRAQTEAGTAAMTASSARNETSLKRIASFNNWLQAWASIAEEEKKGLDPAKAGAARQALRQSYNVDPTPQGFENWKRQTMFSLLPPQDQLQTTLISRDLGGTKQEEVVPTFGQQPGTRTFTQTMTPYQEAQLALEQQREARIAREAAKDEEEPFSALGGYNAKLASAQNVLNVINDLVGPAKGEGAPVFNAEGKLISGGGRIKEGEAGFVGAQAAKLEGTEAFNVAAALDVVKANLGFDRLQEMRADPDNRTGGALGQVAVQELAMLQSTVNSTKQGQSLPKLYDSLNKIRFHYNNYLRAHEDIDALKKFNRINTGPRFEQVPVIKNQVELDALPPGAPYRNAWLGNTLTFKGVTAAPTTAGGAVAGGQVNVTVNGRTFTFPNQAAADAFRQAAGQ